MLQLNDISLQFAGDLLYKHVDLIFQPDHCYGIIGATGAGKSTLLRIISGELPPTTGTVTMKKDDRMSVLEQNHFKYDAYSVMDTVIMGNKRLYEIMQEKDALYAKEDFSDEDGERAAELEGEFAELGGWDAETEAAQLLNGIGIPTEMHYDMMESLDGRQKLKVLLAQALFGDEKAIIRLDLSESMEKHTVSRLMGSPPGYVGHEEGGQLTEAVRRRPYSLVLLDEIEKAHPDVFNLLLQILEDGQLTDARGRRVDFRHTLIIMTSNIGARSGTGEGRVGFSAGAAASDAMRHSWAMSELKRLFRPEFLGRVDEVVLFHPLTDQQAESIAQRLLDRLCKRLQSLGYAVSVGEEVAPILAKAGCDSVYGARPLRRAIQTRVEDPLAEKLLAGDYRKGDTVTITATDGTIVFR